MSEVRPQNLKLPHTDTKRLGDPPPDGKYVIDIIAPKPEDVIPQYIQDDSRFILETNIINSSLSLEDISAHPPFPPYVFSEFQQAVTSSIGDRTSSQQELIMRRHQRQAPNRFPSLTIRQQGAQYLSLTLGYELAK